MKKILISLSLLLLPVLALAADNIPAGCVDIDGNSLINEIDCGAPENDNCTASLCGGTGGETTGGTTNIPAGCVDIDGNSLINEIDCGAPENDNCSASLCGGTGTGTGGGTGGKATGGAGTDGGGNRTGGFQLPPGNPITENTISDFLTSVANFLIAIGVLGAVITIVTAGIMYFGAGFSSNAVTKAKSVFKGALIGTLIILSVGVIINTISIIISGEFFNLN